MYEVDLCSMWDLPVSEKGECHLRFDDWGLCYLYWSVNVCFTSNAKIVEILYPRTPDFSSG